MGDVSAFLGPVHWAGAGGSGSGSAPPPRVVRAGWDAAGAIGVLQLARPHKGNAWSADMWAQWGQAVAELEAQDTIRVVILCAEGPTFTGGLDLEYLATTFGRHTAPGGCPARQRLHFLEDIKAMQEAYSALERQRWPVIAAVQGACVGAGVDLVTACDMRYATTDAYFCVKEVDVGITADLGTLQRLPAIVGHGAAAELALTGRRMSGEEAVAAGLVSRAFPTWDAMMSYVVKVAADIAAKSPLAVWGTKRVLLRTRDGGGGGGGAAAGLEHVALHNAAFLLSQDIGAILAAGRAKKRPVFSKL